MALDDPGPLLGLHLLTWNFALTPGLAPVQITTTAGPAQPAWASATTPGCRPPVALFPHMLIPKASRHGNGPNGSTIRR